MHTDGNRWTFTRKFAKKKGQSNFLKRLDEARSYFPELDGHTVKIGITINADGKADLIGKGVFFRSRNVSYYVMGHELTHLLQEMEGLPKSERSCDIFTMARGALFCDESPNYVKIPKRMVDEKGFIRNDYREFIHGMARIAVNLKNSGERRYIQWFERTLKELMVKDVYTQEEGLELPEWIVLQEPNQTTLEEFF
jgi:hypothetical protein